MARFKFPMQSLLQLRERIEDQKKEEFGKAAAFLEQQRNILLSLENQLDLSVESFRKDVENLIDPLKNDISNKHIKLMKEKILKQEKNVEEARRFLEVKRAELLEATMEKKKLEKLREKRYEQYLIDEKRDEQSITDEVVSYKTYARN